MGKTKKSVRKFLSRHGGEAPKTKKNRKNSKSRTPKPSQHAGGEQVTRTDEVVDSVRALEDMDVDEFMKSDALLGASESEEDEAEGEEEEEVEDDEDDEDDDEEVGEAAATADQPGEKEDEQLQKLSSTVSRCVGVERHVRE